MPDYSGGLWGFNSVPEPRMPRSAGQDVNDILGTVVGAVNAQKQREMAMQQMAMQNSLKMAQFGSLDEYRKARLGAEQGRLGAEKERLGIERTREDDRQREIREKAMKTDNEMPFGPVGKQLTPESKEPEVAPVYAEYAAKSTDPELLATGRLNENRPPAAPGMPVPPPKFVGTPQTIAADIETKAGPALAKLEQRKRSEKAMPGGGSPGFSMSPEAMDQAAEMFAATGQMPQLGYSRQSAAVKVQIANRAAKLHPEADLAGNKAGYGAGAGSMKKLQSQADAVDAFEKTASANLDRAIGAMGKLWDTGSPLLNVPARALQGMAGPEAAAANAARTVAMNEISKVLSGGTASGAVTDSARKEAEGLIGPNMTMAQVRQVADILRKDMASRKASFASQLGEMRGRTGKMGPPAGMEQFLGKVGQIGAGARGAPAQAGMAKPGQIMMRSPDGQVLPVDLDEMPDAIKNQWRPVASP